MSRSSVMLFAENKEWSVIVVEDGGESRHPFRLHKHAASFAYGQRMRLGFSHIDFAACGNANVPVVAR